MLDPKYERRIRRAFLWAFTLCLCAIPPLLSIVPEFMPQAEPAGQWFERSGAVMTVFAVFAQFKATSIATMIAGQGFAETWEAYRKYNSRQKVAEILSLVLIVVWGYGDLLISRPRAEPSNGNCVLLCSKQGAAR
jgi:hypothetical protein